MSSDDAAHALYVSEQADLTVTKRFIKHPGVARDHERPAMLVASALTLIPERLLPSWDNLLAHLPLGCS